MNKVPSEAPQNTLRRSRGKPKKSDPSRRSIARHVVKRTPAHQNDPLDKTRGAVGLKSISVGSTTALCVLPTERLGGCEMVGGTGFPSTKPCRTPLSSARPGSTNCFPGRPNSRPVHSYLIRSDVNCIGAPCRQGACQECLHLGLLSVMRAQASTAKRFQRCGQPGQQHGLRFPSLRLEQPHSIR